MEVLALINADRAAAGGKDPLDWEPTWAAACEDHSYGLEQAGDTNPSPDHYDNLGNQLLDFDDDNLNYYLDNVAAYAFGTLATGPEDFYNKIKGQTQLWNELMEDACEKFGCGFYDDTWEMMCTYTP